MDDHLGILIPGAYSLETESLLNTWRNKEGEGAHSWLPVWDTGKSYLLVPQGPSWPTWRVTT